MKNIPTLIPLLFTSLLLSACSGSTDPLSPGSTDGNYAVGVKALVPLAVGNHWTYDVVLLETSGAERTRYSYDLTVVDSVTADTGSIPLIAPNKNRKNLSRDAIVWYRLQGESGAMQYWQIDTLENLRIRRPDDTRFFEQTAFNFRASVGEIIPARYMGPDTSVWGSGEIFITSADTVRSTLVSKGVDTLRTTLGSAPYFQYRLLYSNRADYTDYYFKPGFGLILIERFTKKPDGTFVCTRRDKLASYYFK